MTRARQLLGMAMLVAALLVMDYLVFDLARYGTCATGGPYVSARQCAPDTGLKIGGLFGAVFGGLIGLGLARSARVGIAAWGMLFCGLGITFFMVSFGPAAGDSGFTVAALIVGPLFLLMGLPGLVGSVTSLGPARTTGGAGGNGGASARSPFGR